MGENDHQSQKMGKLDHENGQEPKATLGHKFALRILFQEHLSVLTYLL